LLLGMFCSILRHALLLVFFLVMSASCHATPTPFTRTTIFPRQDGTSGSQTVTTTQQIFTEAGTFTQTCTIVLTPITGDNGENLVREVKSCTITMDSGSGTAASPPSSTSGGGGGSAQPVISLTTSTSTGNATPTPTTTPVAGVVAGSVSHVPNPALTGKPSAPAPSSGANSSSLSSSVTAAGAAADTTSFDPPGKKLQVLPIGLGIFAGVSVIGILIVGMVTYERTKHRRNFRKRKLAEAGAGMGQGGMAQVPYMGRQI